MAPVYYYIWIMEKIEVLFSLNISGSVSYVNVPIYYMNFYAVHIILSSELFPKFLLFLKLMERAQCTPQQRVLTFLFVEYFRAVIN